MKYSFVTFGRDDDYGVIPGMDGPHYVDRLRYSQQSSRDLDPEAELILVSVGEFPQEKLIPGVKVIVVPLETIERKYPGYNFPMAYLLNVGIRAARGDYIVAHASDDVFGPNTLEVLSGNLAPRRLYTIAKFYASHEPIYNGKIYWEGTKTPKEMLDILWPQRDNWRWHDAINQPAGMAAYDVLIMSKDAWHYIRGFDEIMPGSGWIDQQLCYRTRQLGFSFLDMASLGARIWHLDHLQGDKHKTFFLNPRMQRRPICNGDDWGTV